MCRGCNIGERGLRATSEAVDGHILWSAWVGSNGGRQVPELTTKGLDISAVLRSDGLARSAH